MWWKRRHTALALSRVSKLLETAANLLGRSALACDLEDVVGDELVAHRKSPV